MKIVAINKHDQSDSRELSADEIGQIVSGGELAQSLFNQLRLAGSHLHCYCQENPAVMFLRARGGTVHLVNHYGKGQHSEHCVFSTTIKGFRETHSNSSDAATVEESGRITSFFYHKPQRPQQTSNLEKKPESAETSSNHYNNHLELLIHQLIEDSFSNWHYPNKHITANSALERLKSAASSIEFASSALSDFIHVSHKGFRVAYAHLYEAMNNGQFKDKEAPQSFVFFVANYISSNKVGSLRFDGVSYKLKRVVHASKEITGPYFICMTLNVDTTANKVRPHTAYIFPIVSQDMIAPVYSENDRRLAIESIQRVNDKGNQLSLKKVLATSVDRKESMHYIPSLLVQQKRRKKVIFRAIITLEDKEVFPNAQNPATANAWRVNCSESIRGADEITSTVEDII